MPDSYLGMNPNGPSNYRMNPAGETPAGYPGAGRGRPTGHDRRTSRSSLLASWQHYVGGRDALIDRVRQVYGVDITPYYDEPIPIVLRKVRDGAA
jgi:hypothetical protein